jgi:hypothetical protein
VSRDEGSFQDLAPVGGRSDRGSPEQRDVPEQRDAPDGQRMRARVEESVPPLVPRSSGEILDLALEILRDRFALIAGTCALLWVPVRVLEPFIGSTAWADKQDSMGESTAAFLALGGLMTTASLQILVQALASALVARLVYATLNGERIRLRTALGEASRRVVGLIVIALITALVSSIGCCFFFAPFVYLNWKLSVAPSVYVLEKGRVGESISRSFALTPGSFLRWLAIVLVVFFLALPFSGLVAVQPQARAYILEALSIPGGAFDAVMIVLSSIFMGLATAIGSVTMTLFYLDCRVRREGYDLRRALDEMRAGHGPPEITSGASA